MRPSAFVFTYIVEGGVWLAQLRSKAVHSPLTWCFPGGGREPGETEAQNAQREFGEETGKTPPLETLRFIGQYGERALFALEANRPFRAAPNPEVAFHTWLPLGFEPSNSAPWMAELYKAAWAAL